MPHDVDTAADRSALEGDRSSDGSGLAVPHPRDGIDPIPEVIGEQANFARAEKWSSRRPNDPSRNNGPDLLELRCNDGEVLPSFNNSASDGGTHDVNDEMIAEE